MSVDAPLQPRGRWAARAAKRAAASGPSEDQTVGGSARDGGVGDGCGEAVVEEAPPGVQAARDEGLPREGESCLVEAAGVSLEHESGQTQDDELTEELELLRAVWPDEEELRVERPAGRRARLVFQLYPLTAGEDLQRFVRCELVMEVPLRYPSAPVRVSVGSSRGLSEEQSTVLLQALAAKAESLVGEVALYALAEAAQEALTALNAPVGECAICLRDLEEADAEPLAVARTPCFHAFHASCLANYWWAEWQRQAPARSNASHVSSASVLCPECRSVLRWAEMPQLHGLLEARMAELPMPEEEHVAEEEDIDAAAEGAEPQSVELSPGPQAQVSSPVGNAKKSKNAEPEVKEVIEFEVVHHCGTCYRTAPRWNSKLDKGMVRKGLTGVVAETIESDTTYIRPEGSRYWLPVKGLSAGVKIIHLEKTREAEEEAPLAADLSSAKPAESRGTKGKRKSNRHGGE